MKGRSFYLSGVCSFGAFIIYGNNIKEWKKYLRWIIIGILPILYFTFMMILVFLKLCYVFFIIAEMLLKFDAVVTFFQ